MGRSYKIQTFFDIIDNIDFFRLYYYLYKSIKIILFRLLIKLFF